MALLTTLLSQKNLIFSGAQTQGAIGSQFQSPVGSELVRVRLSGSGHEIALLFGGALSAEAAIDPEAASRPTMLFFYGNGGCLATSLYEFDLFRRCGANVVVVELPGYGLSGGEPGESACRAAADAALAYAASRGDVNPARIVASGWSLGGAIAIDLAARHKLAGLATFSTFTSIAAIAKMWFPILPAGLANSILIAKFDSLSKIGNVDCPILIGHGRQDRTIPFTMATRLRDAAKSPVTFIEFDSDHNDTFGSGGDAIAAALRAWLPTSPA